MTCVTALRDISGKLRLETEDNRWLLTDLTLLSVRGDEPWWEDICSRFITHNTGNLLMFVDKAKHLLRQVLVQRGKHLPSSRNHVEQCCISLHLVTLLVHRFVRTLSDDEMETLLSCGESDGVFLKLIEEVAALLHSTAQSDLSIDPVLHDLLFFSVTFLIAVLSSQLYDSFASSPVSSLHHQPPHHHPQQHTTKHQPSHALLRCFFSAAEAQMQRAMTFSTSSGCGVSNHHNSSFSAPPPRSERTSSAGGRLLTPFSDPAESLASQVVRGLLKIVSPECMGAFGAAQGLRDRSASAASSVPQASSCPLGLSTSSLANYRDRLIPAQTTPHHEDRDAPAPSAALSSLLYFPWRLLKHLYSPDASSADSSDGTLPTYHYDPSTHQIVCAGPDADAATVTPSPAHPLSLPTMHTLTAPLLERSQALLHLLLQNRQGAATLAHGFSCKERAGTYANPFQQALGLVHDADLETSLQESSGGAEKDCGGMMQAEDDFLNGGGDLEGGGGGHGHPSVVTARHGIHVNFLALTDSISARLAQTHPSPPPSTLLLLYTLLHTHATYLPLLVASGRAQSLLVMLLKTLYGTINTISIACKQHLSTDASTPSPATVPTLESLYLVVINILLIVQDLQLRPLLSKVYTRGEDLSWYREKVLGEVSLGDLTLLCTIRATMTTLQHLHDSYLLANLLAVLQDLSPFLQHMSPYCCERVVVLTVRLCRKYTKHLNSATAVGSRAPASSVGEAGGDDARARDMGECLKVLLALVATSVRDPGRQLANHHMLYTLARKYPDISPPDAFGSPHVTALFRVFDPPSSEPPSSLGDAPASSHSPPLPQPLSRSNSHNQVPSLARNTSGNTLNLSHTQSTTQGAIHSTPRTGSSNPAAGSASPIPPNIHIIRMTLKGLQLLQGDSEQTTQSLSADSAAPSGPPVTAGGSALVVRVREALVDSEAEIMPNSAAQALVLLTQRLTEQLQQRGIVDAPVDMGSLVTYTYEEAAAPAEFFVPFVWEVTVSGMETELAWEHSQIRLFE